MEHMSRIFPIVAVVAALGFAACGDESDVADVQTQAEQAVEEGREAVEQLDASTVIRETQSLVDDVVGSARRLAEDPQADVGSELSDAEQQARDLAERTRTAIDEQTLDVPPEIADANERLADAAAQLQDIGTAEEARAVIEGELSQVGDQLRDASAPELPSDARQQLDEAREELERLGEQVPELGG